jgi:RimJ/RimL family protein N-acetyltransferase
MTATALPTTLRSMAPADVPAVLVVQEPGAVVGLAKVFPQGEFPFPRDAIARRWLEEIKAPGIDCLVVQQGEDLIGFAAVRADEFMHFGIAVDHWGTGAARDAHDAVLDRMNAAGTTRAWLRVFTGNERGRRFYERQGWERTDERSRSTFPPCPELLRYERVLTRS